jgi:hypothetical protein
MGYIQKISPVNCPRDLAPSSHCRTCSAHCLAHCLWIGVQRQPHCKVFMPWWRCARSAQTPLCIVVAMVVFMPVVQNDGLTRPTHILRKGVSCSTNTSHKNTRGVWVCSPSAFLWGGPLHSLPLAVSSPCGCRSPRCCTCLVVVTRLLSCTCIHPRLVFASCCCCHGWWCCCRCL